METSAELLEKLKQEVMQTAYSVTKAQKGDIIKAIEWLRTLRQKLEDGRLVELPAAPGQTVYIVENSYKYTGTMTEYWKDKENIVSTGKRITCSVFSPTVQTGMFGIGIKQFGETVFLTLEDAERALKNACLNENCNKD